MKKVLLLVIFLVMSMKALASYILIPMDAEGQKNHLKAYGVTYWTLDKQLKVNWLLNYRGGSFLLPDAEDIRRECQIRGVSFEVLSNAKAEEILNLIASRKIWKPSFLKKHLKLPSIHQKEICLGMMP
jgi:hypothetical protein